MPTGVYKRTKIPLADRFHSKYIKNLYNGCWEWNAALNNKGYGVIGTGVGKEIMYAHRLSYELHNGNIPDGMEVCHTCDNPNCVSPKHLFLGTHQDNMDDCSSKGRARGSRVLSDNEVLLINMRLKRGHLQKDIALNFGCNQSTISRINSGEIYK